MYMAAAAVYWIGPCVRRFYTRPKRIEYLHYDCRIVQSQLLFVRLLKWMLYSFSFSLSWNIVDSTVCLCVCVECRSDRCIYILHKFTFYQLRYTVRSIYFIMILASKVFHFTPIDILYTEWMLVLWNLNKTFFIIISKHLKWKGLKL